MLHFVDLELIFQSSSLTYLLVQITSIIYMDISYIMDVPVHNEKSILSSLNNMDDVDELMHFVKCLGSFDDYPATIDGAMPHLVPLRPVLQSRTGSRVELLTMYI